MQGRLSPVIGGKIQAFPSDNWQNEFRIANTANFKVIEWTLDHHNLRHNPLLTSEGQKEIKTLSKETNLTIPSLTGDCFMQAPFWKAKKEDKEDLINNFAKILYSSRELEIKNIVIPLVDNGSLENTSQKSCLLDHLISWTEYLIENDIHVIFESDLGPHELSLFIDDYPSNFGINYDIGNSASLGFDPEEEILSYGSKIKNIHIKDRKFNGTTVPLGEGDADFVKVFYALKKAGYSGNYILETARAKDEYHLEALIKYRTFAMELIK